MKIAVLVMAIMVMCFLPSLQNIISLSGVRVLPLAAGTNEGSISEEKDIVPLERGLKQCRFPKGKPGSVRYDGCVKLSCVKGKWKSEVRTDICCYKQQVHQPHTVLEKILSADNCSSLTIGCGALGQLEYHQHSCAASKQQVEQLETNVEELKTMMQKLIEQKVSTCVSNTPSTTTTTSNTPSTTTTTAAGTTPTPMVEGVLITGGIGAETSTELFLPQTGKTCSLQSLPDKRYYHSLDVVSNHIILCGGEETQTSCLQFLLTSGTGSWTNYTTLARGRYQHTTHVFEKDLLLMGGSVSRRTTEILGKGTKFQLQEDTYGACSIPDGSSLILTGGRTGSSYTGGRYLKTVTRYNKQIHGFVENLPELAKARSHHGCGSYMDKGKKVLVVAGGDHDQPSTEILTSGATSWTAGKPLPWKLKNPASVNMGAYFLLIGGSSGAIRGEVLKFDGGWSEVAMMKNWRNGAGATKLKMNIDNQLNITACY